MISRFRNPVSGTVLERATSDDAAAIALLHAESWRDSYRGMLPDGYLDELVATDRLTFWSDRFNESAPERRVVVKATRDSVLAGFACVLLDAEPAWGARLDNLHVRPQLKGEGIGYALFQAARHWIAQQMPEGSMHLWVVEQNYAARRFYERQGGAIAERLTRHVALDLSVPELRYLWPVGEML